MFNRIAETDVLHIPYRGTGPALVDLIAGQTDMTFTDVMTAIPHLQEGRLKAIGVTTDERSESLPEVPTLEEEGLEDYDVSVFFGVVGPKGMDPEVVQKLNSTFVDVLNEQEVRDLLAAQDRKSTRLNSSHVAISYAVFCLKKKSQPCQVRC